MIKIFDTPIPDVDIIYMTKNHPGKAFILIDIVDRRSPNGTVLQPIGSLKAFCDQTDLDALYSVSNKAKKEGHKVLLDIMPLEQEMGGDDDKACRTLFINTQSSKQFIFLCT